jgi:hypothetical protein
VCAHRCVVVNVELRVARAYPPRLAGRVLKKESTKTRPRRESNLRVVAETSGCVPVRTPWCGASRARGQRSS